MSEQQNSLRTIFVEALEIEDVEQRAAFLAQACGADSALRREVEELIQAHAAAGKFLPEQPAVTGAREALLSTARALGPGGAASIVPVSESPGDRIGRYKLLQQIGEGGCGVVYMAEQEEPVRRRVALKVIKLGMDTKQVVARFEAERQALALMDHPNIARVLDAGATETGRSYFVMELVGGTKITEYCDENNVTTGERLKLFIQVCHAIQHAHQKGIIHRDIKPSNILVTLHDGVPVPKIIDFGIAKAMTDQKLTDKTLFTAFGQFVGTPAYMSPEQAEKGGLDVDTRSDIYSLGVLLYELLTGKTPFDSKDLLRAGLDEMLRIIRETEPARPSTRLSTMQAADLTAVARHRRVESPKLINLLKGDLDWIVMKTLEKDRARRYETANGLANDIQRQLNNEPVVARPPSNLYRFQKMVRRNKLAFVAASAVAIALILGLGLSTWQYVEKSKAYQRALLAEREQSRLREEAQKSQASEAQLRQQAEATGTRLSESLNKMELQRAEDLFAAGDSSTALAYLARVLRQYPANRVAAERVLSALTHRNFALPSIDPIKHEAAVTSAQFSPDGQRVVTASMMSARIWDAKTGRPLTEPIKHEGVVNSAQFSPDGQRVVTAFSIETHVIGQPVGPSYARVWDANTGQPVIEPIKFQGDMISVQFSPDGQRLLTASQDARVWDAKTGQPLTDPFKHDAQLTSAQFSPDGQRVVTASFDGTARIWDARTGQPIAQPLRHNAPIMVSAEFSSDGQRVITASANQFVSGGPVHFRRDNTPGVSDARVWDANTGQPLTPPLQHGAGILAARFSPDGLRVVTASRDKTARVWDAKTGQPLTESLRHQSEVVSAQFSPDGQRVVTASWDKTARVWDAKTGRPLTEPLRHEAWVASAQFSPDGQQVVTASLDRTARIWDTRIRQTLTEPLKHGSLVKSAHFSSDGQRMVTASYDGTARVWDAKTGRPLIQPLHDGSLDFAQFSPDGLRVVTAGSGGSARVWDAKTGLPLTGPLKHENHVDYAQFSPDGLRVVTASQDNTARIWDAQTGRPLTEPLKHEGVVWSARFSPDGLRVVTASMDKTARVWDANTGRPLTEPLKHEDSVLSAQFSSDGRRVVTSSGDKTARVWDGQTGRPLTGPLKHEDLVYSAQFSPDGRRVVTASQDKTARIWDAQTGQPLSGPLKHEGVVWSAWFSPDGLRVVTASMDKTARVWDAKTGQPLTELLEHEASVAFAQFSPDGQRVVTGSSQAARVWEVPTVTLPVPDWIPKLTEAIAWKRLDDQGISQPVPFAQLQALKGELAQSSALDVWTRWAKWFFADPATRTISPFSVITVREYIERRIEESRRESLLAPTYPK
jgi:WD40 repeat protein/serine/threonine protein kinase